MKFQAAAMGRADQPEDQRVDFSLYVDEFQNFATESFESILSEARKYRLNLILGNQFMTQLTEKIREAIIGNVGTVISGRIGITDAEILIKKFQPTFDAEDLTKMPNYQSIASVMINNVPSAPFSMSFVPPMGEPNQQLADALKRLSAAKYGKPRANVEKVIFDRLGAADKAKKDKLEAARQKQGGPVGSAAGASNSGSSFLDEWLAKRQQLGGSNKPAASGVSSAQPSVIQPPFGTPTPQVQQHPVLDKPAVAPVQQPELLRLRVDASAEDSEVAIKLR